MTSSIKIDYLTWVLDHSKLNLQEFERLADKPIIDEDTGEVEGVALSPDRFKFITVKGGTQLVSFFRGGELFGLKLQKKYGFRVTRLDLALDIEFSSEQEVQAHYQKLKAKMEAWTDKQDFDVSMLDFRGRGTNKNGKAGTVMFTRAGEKQVRVYSKKEVVNPGSSVRAERRVRIELQLMKDLARQVYDVVAPAYPLNKKVLFDVFQSVVMKTYHEDLFELGKYNPHTITLTPKVKPQTNFQDWIYNTVVPALVKFQQHHGVDLTPEISAMVQSQVLLREANKVSPDQKARHKIFKAAEIRLEQAQQKVRASQEDAALNDHLADISREG